MNHISSHPSPGRQGPTSGRYAPIFIIFQLKMQRTLFKLYIAKRYHLTIINRGLHNVILFIKSRKYFLCIQQSMMNNLSI